jgi:hypothetical protein
VGEINSFRQPFVAERRFLSSQSGSTSGTCERGVYRTEKWQVCSSDAVPELCKDSVALAFSGRSWQSCMIRSTAPSRCAWTARQSLCPTALTLRVAYSSVRRRADDGRTVLSACLFTAGNAGSAAQLSGSFGLKVEATSVLSSLQQFSALLWVQVQSLAAGQEGVLLYKYHQYWVRPTLTGSTSASLGLATAPTRCT